MSQPAKHTNALARETSPYLLQHAHNPVNWFAWGEEAFRKAEREGKPIFLSIGYSTCHWCHVMERESFEDEGIAAILNEHFVAIKVDREERPDLDDIYMQAVMAFTGGRGGWPMSVFLTPDLNPFFGGTYFPREHFKQLLLNVAKVWRERRAELEKQGKDIAATLRQWSSRRQAGGAVAASFLDDALSSLREDFEPRFGGFGGAPKFPPHQALNLILRRCARTPDDALLHLAAFTLDRMARGGLYDQVGGGFHRYSTDNRWLVPHFEKMLYDNAQLAEAYVLAFALTKGVKKPVFSEKTGFWACYERIARETFAFVLREMTGPHGGFYSALDADSLTEHGQKVAVRRTSPVRREEGAYYVWTPVEVKAVLGDEDGELFCKVYDITKSGNFEGKSIPNLIGESVEEWAGKSKTSPAALWQRLDAARQKLLTARQKRPYPHLDDKVLVSWNALMVSSFARGYEVLGDARYREAAEEAARFLLTTLRTPDGKLLHTFRAGQAKVNGYLDDYASLTVALLDLHDATKDAQWLTRAQELAEKMVALFWDEKDGGFFFTPSDSAEKLPPAGEARPYGGILRMKTGHDTAEPSGNALAAQALIRLARLTGRADLREKAERTLSAFQQAMQSSPRAMAGMLVSLDMLLADRRARDEVVCLAAELPRLRVGQKAELVVRVAISDGWHIQSVRPKQQYLVPTKAEFHAPAGLSVQNVRYPEGALVKVGEDELSVYSGTVEVRADVVASERAAAGTAKLRVKLSYQPCDAQRCLAPSSVTLDAPIEVAGDG